MRSLLLLFSFLTFGIVQAQTFEKTLSITPNKNNEYANAGLELSNGKYLIGINNTLFCLAQNGDSLWTKTYTGYGYIDKLFKNNQGEIIVATTLGKMVFLKINENNGDTLSSFRIPTQFSNSGYTIYDALVLPDGDYVLAYTNGGGNGGVVTRFSPGSTTRKWSNDYAGQNASPKTLLLDDTTIVFAGYKGNPKTNWDFDLFIEKISINNIKIWSRAYLNQYSTYKDRLVGLQKNNQNQYLLAANFPFNNRACAAILKVANNGDSLGLSVFATHKGDTINHGYCYSLTKNGNNGFYAAGLMNVNAKDPANKVKGVGYMAIFEVNDNGQITKSAAYNSVGIFESSTNNYEPSQAWGTNAFKTSDGSYLIYGIGNALFPGTTGWIWQSQFRGYVVKNSQFSTSINEALPITNTSIHLYPNPFNHSLFVEAQTEILQIKIYDCLGKEVLTVYPGVAQTEINLSGQNQGMYLVQTETKSGTQLSKVIKY